jgi:hypothetical protein
MATYTDPNQVRLTGENQYMRLHAEENGPMSTRASDWQVLLSRAGSGYLLFLRSNVPNEQIRIYADNIALARWPPLDPSCPVHRLPVYYRRYGTHPSRRILAGSELCLREGLVNSAASRAYYAMFQAAQVALEAEGLVRSEWSHKGMHCKFQPRTDPAKEALSESVPGLSHSRSHCPASGRLRGVRD